MGVKSPGRKRGRGSDPSKTRDALVDAAAGSLLVDGYSGTTARSIGARADCNQAAIYYHFGGIDELLVVALQRSSDRCLARYQAALVDTDSMQDLVLAIEQLYREDSSNGHLRLLTEMVGGITASPELRAGIEAATQPWIDFVEGRVAEVLKSLPFGSGLPARDLADLVFSIVTGVELRNKLDDSQERADRLFRMARMAAALADSHRAG